MQVSNHPSKSLKPLLSWKPLNDVFTSLNSGRTVFSDDARVIQYSKSEANSSPTLGMIRFGKPIKAALNGEKWRICDL